MVYHHNLQRVPVGKIFYKGNVPVIICIGVVFRSGAYLLQGINNNEPAVWILFQIFLKLNEQTV